MAREAERIAMVAMHTSPSAQPGTGDAGGLNVAVLGIAAELALTGVEVELITRAIGLPGSTRLLPGVTLTELEAGPPGPLPKHQLPDVVDEFGEAVARLARTTPYDVIHAHYWLSGLAVLPVAIELGLPLVQSFHSVAAMKSLASGDAEPVRRARSESFVARQADAVITASSAEATVVIDEVGAPADRTWIIPPGVDSALFSPRGARRDRLARRSFGLDDDRPVLVVIGRVQPFKGHELAVRALGELRSSGAPMPYLVIAGEPTPGDESFVELLRALAVELGVDADVRFAGALSRERTAELLSAATLTLVPSFAETFGLVALESAASGTPVVAFRGGGLAESVVDGVSGVLLATRDPARWASAIVGVLEDAPGLEVLGVTARSNAERYSWAATATALSGVYSGVMRLRR